MKKKDSMFAVKDATFAIIALKGPSKDKVLANMGDDAPKCEVVHVPCWVVEVTETHVAAKLGSEPSAESPTVLIPQEHIESLFGA